MSQIIDVSINSKDEWIEVFPYGVVIASENSRPVMLFKDKTENHVLPVWLSPIDAGITISQTQQVNKPDSPHDLTWKILKPLNVKLQKVTFVELKGFDQIVELQFEGVDHLDKLRTKAEQAMSFCLSTETKFFCTKKFVQACREMDGEVEQLEMGGEVHPDLINHDHPYIM